MRLRDKYTFRDLTFTIKHDFEGIPLDINISKIKPNFCEEIELEVFQGENDYKYIKSKELNSIKRNFEFINYNEKLYDDTTNTFISFLDLYDLKNIEDLLYREDLDLGFFIRLNDHIDNQKNVAMNIFLNRVYTMFGLYDEEPKIKIKQENTMNDEIKKYTKRDRNYMIGQLKIEYNSTPIFQENIDKCMEEWSWREMEYQLAFITSKHNKESVESKYHISEQEKLIDKNKT